MNLYFVLEGEKTEVYLYPRWISYLLPVLTQVDFEKDVVANNYYVFSGGGIPSIYNHVVNAIKNINDNPVFDKLIVCLDGEEIGADERVMEVNDYIKESGVMLNKDCELNIVVQDICIETWFLGNRKIVKKIPEGLQLRKFIEHYNVVVEDPEMMDKIEGFVNKARFHYSYFREILKEHNLSYKKSKPTIVLEKSFFNELERRVTDTNHLISLKNLLTLLYKIKATLKEEEPLKNEL